MATNDGSQRSVTPSTYNPSANSPIKAPEAKFCITCGQPIAPDVRPLTNEMSVYVNSVSGNRVAINGTKDVINIQGVDLFVEGGPAYTKWLADKAAKEAATKVPAPTTPPPTK